MEELYNIDIALANLKELAARMDMQIEELKDAATAYAEEAAAARKEGDKVTPFGGSAQHNAINDLVLKLQNAHRTIGNIGGELVRFV
jgi:hypothetical protein